MKVLVADDDAVSRFLIQHQLESAGYEIIAVDNGHLAANHLSRAGGPRLAVLDWVMPGLDGPGVCRAIRAGTDQPYVYIILLTANESKADVVAGLEAGADDYLTKPCHPEELKARLRAGQRILELQDKLYHDAIHDCLTQLPNRAHFIQRLTQCVNRSKMDQSYRFAVLFVDLDRFKTINDTLGHSAGDELLRQVAERLRGSMRREDRVSRVSGSNTFISASPENILARLGGDEFTVLIDDIRDPADATRIATRIRHELTLPFSIAGREVRITASIGISVSTEGSMEAEDLLHGADAAMYRSRTAQRAMVLGPEHHNPAPN
jgi:two-component system cell cycle response regulator